MRQSFIPIFLLASFITACAAPAPATFTPPPPAPHTAVLNRAVTTVQPTLPAAAASTSVPDTVEAAPAPNNPTAVPPTLLPTSSPTATAVPSPTPVPAELIRLMDGACCASPGWYADSETILFIDKPTADAPTGIYSVKVNAPNKSSLWNERIAFYTREYDYAQIPEQAGTRLIRVSDGKEIRVKNGGRQVSFSPDRTRILWTESRETFPIENRVSNIMLAPFDFDGEGVGEAQRVTQVMRGGGGWLDDNRLLLNGRLSRDTEDSTTFVYDLTTGKQTVLFTAERSRLSTVSRGGSWLAYAIVNDKDETRDGLWTIRTDGTGNKKLEMFGSAQWRDDTHLIIAPLEMGAPTHSFYEYDAETGETRRLTPPDQTFKIASGDWSISPDGNKIVFVNAADNNLWLWKFARRPQKGPKRNQKCT